MERQEHNAKSVKGWAPFTKGSLKITAHTASQRNCTLVVKASCLFKNYVIFFLIKTKRMDDRAPGILWSTCVTIQPVLGNWLDQPASIVIAIIFTNVTGPFLILKTVFYHDKLLLSSGSYMTLKISFWQKKERNLPLHGLMDWADVFSAKANPEEQILLCFTFDCLCMMVHLSSLSASHLPESQRLGNGTFFYKIKNRQTPTPAYKYFFMNNRIAFCPFQTDPKCSQHSKRE